MTHAHIKTALSNAKLLDFPSLVKKNYTEIRNKYKTQNEQSLKALTAFELLKTSYIEDGCQPYVTWNQTRLKCYDSLEVKLSDGQSLFRHDGINDQKAHVNFLSLKRALLELTAHECDQIVEVCLLDNDLEVEHNLHAFVSELYGLAFTIFENEEIGSETALPSIETRIDEELTKLISEHLILNNHDTDSLSSPDTIKKLCKQLIINLFSSVTASQTSLTLFGHHYEFTRLTEATPVETSDFKSISLFPPTPLTSKNISEEPFITSEPLQLAIFLSNPSHQDIESCPEFTPFAQWIEKQYYLPLCAAFMKQLDACSSQKKTSQKIVSHLQDFIKNDRDGVTYKKWIEKEFTIEQSWFFRGNCFLAALYPEYKQIVQMEEMLLKTRALIAKEIKKAADDYVDYVLVIPDFFSLPSEKKLALSTAHWAIAASHDLGARIRAVETRCDMVICNTELDLMEPEYNMMSELIKAPIHIYKQDTHLFKLNQNQQIEPSVIYGKHLPGKPRYLLEYSQHFKALTHKSSSSSWY
ncbi:MAG: hypothetical protein QRY72_02125 [Candidatus Rhabdochlamydia sp.]